MTFTVLHSLYAIIGEALDDIERVYSSQPQGRATASGTTVADASSYSSSLLFTKDAPISSHISNASASISSAYASPPPSPGMPTKAQSSSQHCDKTLDFPSLDNPYDPTSPAEILTSHPTVVVAINRILAAAGQMAATVQTPFMAICDATMAYHLPSCMRILEASNTVEILHEAGPAGLHVRLISELNGIEESKLAHILRLLATHHIMREVAPNVFALNRISSLVHSGKKYKELREFEALGRPELKYANTNGIAAFVGLCTDEIYKSSAYMTETYLLSPSAQTREGQEPTQAPFCYAFDTIKTGTGYFGWLEGETKGNDQAEGRARMDFAVKAEHPNPNLFRLERFGKAMSGTGSWEAPGAVLHGFDWQSLSKGSLVVDVGGGIGSTSMLLATASEDRQLDLRFVIQDRPVVVEMGEKAWRAKSPQLLQSGVATFQEHDFFAPQPVKDAAVFLLRVILHDWPDDYARRILLQLREAATPQTKLLIADWVLPLACPDDTGSMSGLEGIEGAESILASSPLLPNLGKASANAYWMDLTMQVMFNAQERTLREIVALALSAGWKVIKVTKAVGSLFGHITAVPVPIPTQRRSAPTERSCSDLDESLLLSTSLPPASTLQSKAVVQPQPLSRGDVEVRKRSGSRCDTFGSRTELLCFDEGLSKFGGASMCTKESVAVSATAKSHLPRPAATSHAVHKKKRPSPLVVLPRASSSGSRSTMESVNQVHSQQPRISMPLSSASAQFSSKQLSKPSCIEQALVEQPQNSSSLSMIPVRHPHAPRQDCSPRIISRTSSSALPLDAVVQDACMSSALQRGRNPLLDHSRRELFELLPYSGLPEEGCT